MRAKSLLALVFATACVAPTQDTENLAQTLNGDTPGAGAETFEEPRWPGGTINYVIDDGTFGSDAPGFCAQNAPIDGVGIASQNPATPTLTEQVIDQALASLSTLIPSVQFKRLRSRPRGAFLFYTRVGHSFTQVRGIPDAGPNNASMPSCVGINSTDIESRPNLMHPAYVVWHETFHALGADHEQQRPDRNQHVVYKPACDSEIANHHVNLLLSSSVSVTPYDIDSIMEYGSDGTTSTCSTASVLSLPSPCPSGKCGFPTPETFSVHDINGMTRLYEKPLGSAGSYEDFGAAIATGDFDGDGYIDLAIGAPYDSNGAGKPLGAVYLFKGTASATAADQLAGIGRMPAWKRLSPADFVDSSHGMFGFSLAAGDFDNDGNTDLAVGAPGDWGSSEGGVVYLYNSDIIVTPYPTTVRWVNPWRVLSESTVGISTDVASQFGYSLAVGKFTDATKTELAVGAPNRLVLNGTRAGEVFLFDATTWPTTSPDQMKPSSFTGGSDFNGAQFGFALHARDFDLDSAQLTDLVIGSPESGNPIHGGSVYLARGEASARMARSQMIAAPTGFGAFGSALASGHYDASQTAPQLVVGAPSYSDATHGAVGELVVYKGVYSTFAGVQLYSLTQQTTLHPSNPQNNQQFGAVLTSGSQLFDPTDTLFVGVPSNNSGNGGVAIYEHGTTGGSVFIDGKSTCGIDGQMGGALGFAQFGTFVGHLIVGCPLGDSTAGSVHFATPSSGTYAFAQRFTQETANPE